MKFIKLITKNTNSDLQEIVSKFSKSEKEFIERIYCQFEYIEFIDKQGFVGMFAVVNNITLNELVDFYVEKSIPFSYQDLSNDVLFGNEININEYKSLFEDKSLSDEIKQMKDSFYIENITVDVILEKINQKGISELSEKDLSVLNF
jgi:hypothetical protein